jgi:hypothetical protein
MEMTRWDGRMAIHIRRRELIAVLGGTAAATLPLVAREQQPVLPVIGILGGVSPSNR